MPIYWMVARSEVHVWFDAAPSDGDTGDRVTDRAFGRSTSPPPEVYDLAEAEYESRRNSTQGYSPQAVDLLQDVAFERFEYVDITVG